MCLFISESASLYRLFPAHLLCPFLSLQWFPADYLFDMTTSQKFDILIMVVIMLNMVTMTLEHYNQTLTFTNTLYWINFSFIVVFTAECIMKLLALRQYYFKIPWNVFDFAVVVLSVLGTVFFLCTYDYFY